MRNVLFLVLAVFGFSEEIEVRLKTASELKALYLRMEHPFRNIVEFDLNQGGYAAVLPQQERCDKEDLYLSFWRREKVPFVAKVEERGSSFYVSLLNVDKNTTRHFEIGATREGMHQLSDMIHKEFFGVHGIASCKLIYSQKVNKGSEIAICDYDGVNPEQITFDNDTAVTPSFVPGSDDFIYVSYKQGQSKIFRSSLKAQKSELAFELRGSQVLPALDREGAQMAFISDVAGRPDLFLHSFGKAKQLFTAPRATQASPTFSPNGRKLAFVSDKDGSPRIYLLDLHAPRRNLHLLTKRNRENTSPAWSPDGKKLAYSAKVDGVRQIWIYDFETDEESPLTVGGVNKENPAWAPDSLHLAYNTEFEDEADLYLINLKQRTPVQIGKGRFPSWK